MDDVDRSLLKLLQEDATKTYADLGEAVGLSSGAVHERVRKLRTSGVILRTTIDVDPASLGREVVAFVLIEANAWMGDSANALAAIATIEEAHIIAGAAAVLVKVRTASTEQLQSALQEIFDIDAVTGTQAIVVLKTFFERQLDPRGPSTSAR